jgi:hypothetical protein
MVLVHLGLDWPSRKTSAVYRLWVTMGGQWILLLHTRVTRQRYGSRWLGVVCPGTGKTVIPWIRPASESVRERFNLSFFEKIFNFSPKVNLSPRHYSHSLVQAGSHTQQFGARLGLDLVALSRCARILLLLLRLPFHRRCCHSCGHSRRT